MNNNDNFENIYSQLTDMFAEEFEETRRKVRGDMIWNIVIFIILTILFILLIPILMLDITAVTSQIILYIIFIISLFVIFCCLLRKNSPKDIQNYKKTFKEKVINHILSSFNLDLKISPEEGFPEDLYKKANFDKNYTSYSSEDLIFGKISNNYNYLLGEVLTFYRPSDDSSIYESFNGLVAKIDLQNSFTSSIFCRSQHNEFLKFAFTPKLPERVLLDSSEFEKLFNVYCDNDLLAMQILTPDVQLILSDFYQTTNLRFDFTLEDNSLFIRFWTGGSMFEAPSIFSSTLDKELLEYYYTIIEFTINLSTVFTKILNDIEHL